MTVAILSILAALIPFGIWLVKRRAQRKDDPNEQHRARYRQIDEDVATIGKGSRNRDMAAHARMDLDELDRLQNQRRGDSR